VDDVGERRVRLIHRCFVLAGDQLTKESAYTALSRARYGTDLYVVSEHARADDAHVSEL